MYAARHGEIEHPLYDFQMRCSSDSLMCKKLDSDSNGCRCEKRGLGKTVCDLRKTSHIYILKILSRHIIRQEKMMKELDVKVIASLYHNFTAMMK